ncbi:hypothetical protein DEO72_LG2g401 [Vigna unguiculata]|uniref:Uncharacterized protein n=1 Tax=Vigna unguiculata TaxID=3917 RepID=A0A4D6KRA3_VIGUN|nr:hypothetical protein DEO72_LG2g401 [Vigna unguiculata]
MAEAGCPALTLPNQFGEEWWWMPEAVNGNERSLPVIEKCGGSGANQNPYSTRFGADAGAHSGGRGGGRGTEAIDPLLASGLLGPRPIP